MAREQSTEPLTVLPLQGAAESNGSLLNDLIGVKGRIILETIIKMLKYILVVNFVRVQVFTLVGQ